MSRMVGAIAGGLLAGVAISVIDLASEAGRDRPSELIGLTRRTGQLLGFDVPEADQPASADEQVVSQGGHLALSVLAGAAYAAIVDRDAPVVSSGVAFGLAFFTSAHGVAGPAFGVSPPLWRQPLASVLHHLLLHSLFGITTAFGARLGSGRRIGGGAR